MGVDLDAVCESMSIVSLCTGREGSQEHLAVLHGVRALEGLLEARSRTAEVLEPLEDQPDNTPHRELLEAYDLLIKRVKEELEGCLQRVRSADYDKKETW